MPTVGARMIAIINKNPSDIRHMAYSAGLCEDEETLNKLRNQYPDKRTEINREWTRGAICALEANGDQGTSKHKVLLIAMKSLEMER